MGQRALQQARSPVAAVPDAPADTPADAGTRADATDDAVAEQSDAETPAAAGGHAATPAEPADLGADLGTSMGLGADLGAGGADVVRVGFAPITRVDAARRELELCATSEAVDSHGTVFDYAASKEAFTRWLGNVREMHERRAVGRRVGIHCDDAARKVFVRIRVSQGAQDTWEKVVDGTLQGASIGASNVRWERQQRVVAGGVRWLPVATRYDLVELSLVDSPSNPDALGFTFVRDALPDTTLLDTLDDEPPATTPPGQAADMETKRDVTVPTTARLSASAPACAAPPVPDARARGPFSPNANGAPDMGVPAPAAAPPTSLLGMGPGGNARERLHGAARAILSGCGCLRCAAALAVLAADDAERFVAPETSAQDDAPLTRALAAGLQASARHLEHVDAGVEGLRALLGATLGELRTRLETIEAQPLPGGPLARPVEKSNALMPSGPGGAGYPDPAEQYRALEALAGRLSDPQAQIAVAAELIRLQRGE